VKIFLQQRSSIRVTFYWELCFLLVTSLKGTAHCINANTLIVFRSENKYVCLHKIWFFILWKRFLLPSLKIAVTLGSDCFVNCAKHVRERTELNLDSWVGRWGKANTFSSKGHMDSSWKKKSNLIVGRYDIKIEDQPVQSCHKAVTACRKREWERHSLCSGFN